MEESTKKEIMGNLIKEQHNIVRKMQREQTRNEEMVRSYFLSCYFLDTVFILLQSCAFAFGRLGTSLFPRQTPTAVRNLSAALK